MRRRYRHRQHRQAETLIARGNSGTAPCAATKSLFPETKPVDNTYLNGQHHAGFPFPSEVHMRMLVAAAVLSALAVSPASAAMMACTADNMMKSTAMMAPGQTPANKELAAANMDMSNGKMGSACRHYMKAQKLSMSK
jgi:hypothetical protein